jgi:hypothetical protein
MIVTNSGASMKLSKFAGMANWDKHLEEAEALIRELDG